MATLKQIEREREERLKRAQAYNRIRAYLDRRKQVRGLDPDHIHGFDASPEGGYELRVSDLETLLDML